MIFWQLFSCMKGIKIMTFALLRYHSAVVMALRFTLKSISLTCIAYFILAAITARADMLVTVTIQGIDGRLYDNVALYLSINEVPKDKDLRTRRIVEMHEDAPDEIRRALEPFGYYSPEISTELKEDEQGWHAKYVINPGEPTLISTVSVKFAPEDEPIEEVLRMADNFSLKQGDVIDHTRYANAKKQLLQKLFSYGYIKAEYTRSEIRVSVENKTAEIDLLVSPGPRFYFGQTIFDQELLDPGLLVGFINFERGEPYSQKKLIELQQILYRTNYFGQVVVRGDVENAQGHFVPVVVKLSGPEFVNRYTFGLGYATDVGVRGRIGWHNRLFNRHGHSISSELELAEKKSSLDFIYGIPVGDPRFDKWLFGATYNEETWDDTDSKLFRGGLSYDHSGGRYKYGIGFEFRDESYEVGTTSGESFLPVPNAHWSVIIGDDIIHTDNGMFFSFKLKGAAEELLADTSFAQGLIEGKLITTPFAGLRLITKFSLGASLVDEIDDLPPSLRFYAGGDQSVRGYGYKDLGSRNSSGIVVGGKYLVFGSIEVEKSVYNNWSLAAFFDTGKGINSLTEDLGKGAGVGVRYKLPFGQIRVDVASAISEEGHPLRLHLTLGADF